jgi:hypothetical protein
MSIFLLKSLVSISNKTGLVVSRDLFFHLDLERIVPILVLSALCIGYAKAASLQVYIQFGLGPI